MLLLQACVRFLERLQLRDLAGGAGWRRLRGATADEPFPHILPPLGQHEGMDLQRGSDRLDLQSRLLTVSDRRQLELIAVLPNCPWP
jgi:hypothetical protein